MKDSKHLTNFISIWIVQILRMAVPAIIILLLGRFYRVEEFGAYSVATSFMAAFSIFLTFGVASSVSYEIAAIDGGQKSKITGFLLSGFAVFALFSIIGFSVIAVALYSLKYYREIILLILLLGLGYWIMGAHSILTAVFLGLKEMSYIAISSFAVLMATIVFVVPLIYFLRPLWEVAITWSLCQGVGLILTGWLLHTRGFLAKPEIKKGQTFDLLKRSFGIGLDSAIYRLGANLTNILLPIYLSSYQIGIFNGAFRPFVLLVLGNQCCIQFLSPYIAGDRYKTKNVVEQKLAILHKLSTFFTLTVLVVPLFFAEPLCRMIFGDHLLNSAPYMQVLALGYFLYYIPPYVAPLKALGLEWKVLWSSTIQVIVNLFSIVLLVPIWGITGAVFSVIFAFASYWGVEI
ncbi:MAG: oligosaccharide flippase family protein, partial [Candidatus Hodarchaeota archaeon]